MIGIVVIGRNEGARLTRCLASLPKGVAVVYADSQSADGSAAAARALGAEVIELDRSGPLTAARGRNEGFERLLQLRPEVFAVQFLDGDCELRPGWLERAQAELSADGKLAVVVGHRRERYPDSSPYARLCSIEWDWPPGDIDLFSGDAMIRASAFKQLGGFNAALLAGEESELCLRLKRADWSCRRIDAEMSIHECAMTRFSQWWMRAVRTGYAYANGFSLYGFSSPRYVRKLRNILLWGLAWPVAAVAGAPFTAGATLLLLLVYPALAWRYAREGRRRGLSPRDVRLYSLFGVLARFPQVVGAAAFWLGRALGGAPVIRYK